MVQRTIIAVTCQAYRKNSDGSWTSVQVSDINRPDGIIRIPPDMTFKKGTTLCGVDVVALLDQNCT